MERVAIVGATGAVGRAMMEDLEALGPPNIAVSAFASPRSAGAELRFRDQSLRVEAYEPQKLMGTRYVLMSAGGGFSKEHSPQLVSQGSIVIDNSSAWRMDPATPLVVPEVNASALQAVPKDKGLIIANPNCSTIQMVVALEALRPFGLKEVQVATYQSVSGSGQKGIKELKVQVADYQSGKEAQSEFYDQPIVFNVLPAIDRLVEGGHCYEEVKMIEETRKIMGLPKLRVFATTARVPTYNCHCESVTVQLDKEITRDEAMARLREMTGIALQQEDDHRQFPTPRQVTGQRNVHVARVRLPYGESRSDRLQFWIVADNLRKGAATNAVQILATLASA